MQAKRSTKAEPGEVGRQPWAHSSPKNIFVSLAPQEMHHPSTAFRQPGFTLDSPGWATYPERHMQVVVVFAAVMAIAAPAFADSATLFRVFLNDGTAVVSYGEYARVGDRLIFSMPIGAIEAGSPIEPALHVVNLPASSVNWTATTRYADSVRYAHYMETSAESDYAALAGEIASTLNAIVLTRDPKTRLDMAVGARRRLASWPRDHYGYRAGDVREMLGMLDEAISELRAATGETSFALDLVATPATLEPREPMRLFPTPSATEAITQAIGVAKATDVAADRMSLLRAILAALDDPRNSLPADWSAPTRKWAVRSLREEARVGEQYAALTAGLLRRSTSAARRADVRGVERVLEAATRRDVELGRRRPDEVNALLEQVRLHLDAARRLRLARDQWQERAGAYRAYQRVVGPVIDGLARAREDLDDIKRLAGSDAAVLAALGGRLSTNLRTLGVVAVPDELKSAHALLVSAVTLAETAVRTRRQAVVSGELAVAWEASSAAAGSMMLLTRAKEDMEAAVRLPELR
jgi:hypothetical protein